jgi:hypothetical protein
VARKCIFYVIYFLGKEKQERHCTYKHNIKALLHNHCCCGKAISITYSECVPIVLFIQHAMCTSILYCHLRRWNNFRKQPMEAKMCFFLQLLFYIPLILRRTEQDIITNVHRSSQNVPVILVRF